MDLYSALLIQFDKYKYTIPKNTKNIDKESLIKFIASRQSTQKGAFGYSIAGWIKFIKKVFPDKPKNTNYYAWLLAKDDLKYCLDCDRVLSLDNFWQNKSNSQGVQSSCIECFYPQLKKKCVISTANYRARKLQAMPNWVDTEALNKIYRECPEGYHVDHIIPLSNSNICGLHVPWNLQYLSKIDNLKKGNKFYSE